MEAQCPEIVRLLGVDGFASLLKRLDESGFGFHDLVDWSERDVADAIADALPLLGVFDRRKAAVAIVLHFKRQAARVSDRGTPIAVGLSGNCVHVDPVRQSAMDDPGHDTELFAYVCRLMRVPHREAIKELAGVESYDTLKEILSRCDPDFLNELVALLRSSEGSPQSGAQEPSSSPLLRALLHSSDVRHTAELREEWRLRAAYLRGLPPQSAADLVELFDGDGIVTPELHEGARRALDAEEQRHVVIAAASEATNVAPTWGWRPAKHLLPSPTGPITTLNLQTFINKFHHFTFNVFRDFTWDGAFVAGGAVLACLANWESKPPRSMHHLQARGPTPKATMDCERMALVEVLRHRFNVPGEVSNHIVSFLEPSPLEHRYRPPRFRRATHPFASVKMPDSADIDVFITASTEAEAMERLERATRQIRDGMIRTLGVDVMDPFMRDVSRTVASGNFSQLHERIMVIRTANAVTLWVGYPVRNVQIIVVMYHSLHEVLSFFDLDCVCFGFDGSQVYGLRRGIRSLQTRTNFVEPIKLRRWSTPPRIIKYAMRGFSTLLFEVCKHTPRCDVEPDGEVALRVRSIEEALEDRGADADADKEFGYGLVDCPYNPRIVCVHAFKGYINSITLAAANAALARKEGREPPPLPHPTRRSRRSRARGTTSSDPEAPKRRAIINSDGRVVAYDEASERPRFIVTDGAHLNVALNPDNKGDSAAPTAAVPPVRWKVDDLWTSRRGNEYLPRCHQCSNRLDPSKTIAERPQLCFRCEAVNEAKRNLRADLSGAVAVVTGARVKVGYAIALKLLRCGATVHATTRFPHDAYRRFQCEEDFGDFSSRLTIHGVDFCRIDAIRAFTSHIKSEHSKLHILINNAAQTVARPPTYYHDALEAERAGVVWEHPSGASARLVVHSDSSHSIALEEHMTSVLSEPTGSTAPVLMGVGGVEAVAPLPLGDASALACRSEGIATVRSSEGAPRALTEAPATGDTRVRDLHGEPLDRRETTSWTSTVRNVGILEATAAHLVNAVAPLQLVSDFHDLLIGPSHLGDGWSFVVNVTSPEGQFSQLLKGPTHVHTNMSKASLGMLTRTIAASLAGEGVFVTSVDSGWVSQMTVKQITPPPLSCEDSAARVLDPIIAPLAALNLGDKEMAEPRCGVLFKHFNIIPW